MDEKEKQEKISEILAEYVAWIIGGFLFILGLISMCYFISDYIDIKFDKSTWFDSTSKVQDLASVILGSTGLFWGLAGTVFFVYTILQTKTEIKLQISEMKATNESLVNQRIQTTFFSLLENHYKMIESLEFGNHKGAEGITFVSNNIISGLERFNKAYDAKVFSNHTVTRQHPFFIINQYKVTIDYYISSFVTILKFIDTKITSEQDFYYQLLYNQLTLSEKYLIGSYVNIVQNQSQAYILFKHKEIFLHHYYNQFPHYEYETERYFPRVNIHSVFNDNHHGIVLSDFVDKKSNYDFTIIMDKPMYDKQLFLESIEMTVLDGALVTLKNDKRILKLELVKNLPLVLSYAGELRQYVAVGDSSSTYVKIDFTFNYEGIKYVIKNEFNFRSVPDSSLRKLLNLSMGTPN